MFKESTEATKIEDSVASFINGALDMLDRVNLYAVEMWESVQEELIRDFLDNYEKQHSFSHEQAMRIVKAIAEFDPR